MMKSALLLAGSLLLTLPAAAAVQGTYASDCQAVQTASATLSFQFATTVLTQNQRAFLDQKCKTQGYDLTISGPYTLDAATGELDYTFASVTLTPLTAQVASAFKAQKLCGVTDWAKDKASNIAGLNCGGQAMPAADTKVFDIVKEVADGIQLGKADDKMDGSSAEKRPTEVDTSLTFHPVKGG